MFGEDGPLKDPLGGTIFSDASEGTGLQINPPINNEGVDQDMFSLPKNPLGIRNGIFDIFSA